MVHDPDGRPPHPVVGGIRFDPRRRPRDRWFAQCFGWLLVAVLVIVAARGGVERLLGW